MAEVIALLGAESTGKTTLAAALADRIGAETGLSCTWVPELLRGWCERMGRVPRQDEQAGIAAAAGAAIDAAAAGHDIVVADTTPLMVAVYSRWVFGDDGVSDTAIRWQRERCAATLVTAPDIGWVADGLQREGPQVQAPIDALIRELLLRGGIGWSVVAGSGAARLASALDAVAPLLRRVAAPRGGFLSRLAARNAQADARVWRCERCDDPDCEHLSRPQSTAGT